MADESMQDRMITGSAAKQPFHFSGDGIYHNMTVWASNLEGATKQWLEKRALKSKLQSNPHRQRKPLQKAR
jgi:hypothetical protein